MEKKNKLVIIDGSAVMYRAWHALPPFSTKDGTVVNAVYGFLLAYFKLLQEFKPTHVVVAFDLPEPTFRHERYKKYKAGREVEPDEFYAQFDILRDLLDAFNISAVEAKGYEADDVIGTISTEASRANLPAIIATSDLDTLQLVDVYTRVYTFRRSMSDTKEYDAEAVKERFGLSPAQMVDYRALRGDASDNIPGVRGIGEKTASALMQTYGTLDNLYKQIKKTEVTKKPLTPRLRQLLLDHEEDALMSKELSVIHCDLKLKTKLDDYMARPPNAQKLVAKLQELEFKSILNKLPDEVKEATTQIHSSAKQKRKVIYTLIKKEKDFTAFVKKLRERHVFALDTETTGLDVITAELLGASFSWKDGEAFYVYLDGRKKFIEELKPILEDAKVKKWGHNIKYDLEIFRGAGIDLKGIEGDTMIAAYLLNPGSRGYGLDNLAFTEFGHKMISITDLIGAGKDQITMRDVELKKLAEYAAEDADYTWRLKEKLLPEVKKKGVFELMKTIEIPLIPVLADMELNGVKVDEQALKAMDKKVRREIYLLEKTIYKLAGEEFNIASPKQLKVVLFEKLRLPTQGIGKIKTGISTAAGELEKLRDKHEIIEKILEYRELAKLHSTYLDALPKQISQKTGRVHTSFNQTITATGRLSSFKPNLQNIPTRTSNGQKVRAAFVAEKGYSLVSADYSQIELRIVASLANDKTMLDIFRKRKDIHRATAAKIHAIPETKVTKEIRYTAKEVNFGVLYGMGAWGLAERTGISQIDAKEFIEKYFKAFAAVKKYLDKIKAKARGDGYVETLFGRRRYLPEINSGVAQVRAAAERAAINLPVQGTAADLMKLAMIHVANKLSSVSAKTKMLLQVHDELVLEVPNDDVERVGGFVKKEMETVVILKAPIEVHLNVGKSWGKMSELKL